MPTHHVADLRQYALAYDGDYPWQIIGVFPNEGDEGLDYQWFNYTSGLGHWELWAPCRSIEGRAAGNEIVGLVLNLIASAWKAGAISFGDNIIVPLGIPDKEDQDSVWWLSEGAEPAGQREVNMTEAEWCVPVRWSSPLGWPDE